MQFLLKAYCFYTVVKLENHIVEPSEVGTFSTCWDTAVFYGEPLGTSCGCVLPASTVTSVAIEHLLCGSMGLYLTYDFI